MRREGCGPLQANAVVTISPKFILQGGEAQGTSVRTQRLTLLPPTPQLAVETDHIAHLE